MGQDAQDAKENNYHKKAKDFERHFLEFLKSLKFSDVNGGENFVINGKQVDAVAGHGNTLLVFEVTTSRKIRNKIESFRGNIPLLKEGFSRHHDVYRKYRDFKFILVTNLRKINKSDLEFAAKEPQIIIWDRRFLDYYADLYDKIGEYAKYNLLGELGIRPSVTRHLFYPALRTKINDYIVYIFFASPKELLKVAYVARREIGKEEYYQRMVNKQRLKKISKFIDEGGIFPNNIIICFEKEPNFVPISTNNISGYDWPDWLEFGILSFPNDYRSAWIIDGQHRLYAFSKTDRNPYISILAFHRLEKEKQAGFFIEINKEQKPVDPNLLWDLEGVMRPRERRGVISNVVKELNKTEPFKDMIYVPLEGPRKGRKIKLTTFCTAIDKRKLVDVTTESGVKNPLYVENYEKRVKKVVRAISKYFLKLKAMFTAEVNREFVFTNAGVSVMLMVYERIIEARRDEPKAKDIEKYIQPLAEYLNGKSPRELADLRKHCTSEAGKKMVFEEFARVIQKVDRNFAPNVKPPYYEEIISFERDIRNTIAKVLSKKSPDWLNKLVPPDVLSNARRKKKNKGDQDALYEFFDLGDCRKIIDHNWDAFESVFVNSRYGFISKNQFLSAFDMVKHYRDKFLHSRKSEFKFGDENLFEIYLSKIRKCIEKVS